ncbi:MAG: SusD/RagB family nutrient-binding outer membrane lipoprotein [Cyclobacteriaceae bacterium]|nr:SusD/RagB family nutrient-binding outer membrane lipoprotein [Cyclobacteriaceae bacterium]
MKRLLIIFLCTAAMMIPLSCADQLDINRNPLTASKADPNAVLPFVIVQYSNRTVTEIGTRMVDVYQHASATFNSPRGGGGAAGGFLSSNQWGMLYVTVLPNLSLVERDARAAGISNNNVAAIAVTLKALAFLDATSLFGDIPFSQALRAELFPQPDYDRQEDVLRGIVIMLDDAMDLIDALPATGTFNVAQGDLIYGGNMTNWRALANSLKIRVLMLLRNKDTSVDAQLTAALGEPYISSNTRAAMLQYPGNPGNQNAWLQIVTAFGTGSNETTNYFGPSPVMRQLLQDDPRLELYCVDGTAGGYKESDIGVFPTDEEARYSNNLIRANLPDIWLLPAEITFYRAELAAKGALAGDANALYRQAVTETLQFWGQTIPGAQKTLTTDQITSFVNGLPDINPLTQAQQLKAIGEQQYLATFWCPIVSWNHVRRTKVPAIEASPGSTITTMLKRLLYSPVERAANPKTPDDMLTDVPMWFEN